MTKDLIERSILINDNKIFLELFGDLDEKVNLIKDEIGINILIQDGRIKLIGEKDNLDLGEKLIYELIKMLEWQKTIDIQDIKYSIQLLKNNEESNLKESLKEAICVTSTGKAIRPKTIGQKKYIEAIKKNDIVFSIGPAGTGKTYLAMAMAIHAFKNKDVNRIILTRPAVEAGENLGFLPGDLQEKVDPYLRPIYDALFEIFGGDNYIRNKEKGLIEVAPLAYMRGRTLDSAYVILDEAQNTTNEQMKMFLTRLGFGSKAIITGDITQIDLPKGKESGLKTVSKILTDIKGIEIIFLSKADIVRHPLVQKIIDAYEKMEKRDKK